MEYFGWPQSVLMMELVDEPKYKKGLNNPHSDSRQVPSLLVIVHKIYLAVTGNGQGWVTEPKSDHLRGHNLGMIP